MGGDDLAGDDDYLLPTKADDDDSASSSSSSSSSSDNEATQPKRKHAIAPAKSPNKKHKSSHSDNWQDLDRQPCKVQCAFLTSQLRHHSQLRNSMSGNQGPDHDAVIPLEPHHFVSAKASKKQPTTNTLASSDFCRRIRETVSLKQLKKWKIKQSPCVLVICVSARRAVQLLKDDFRPLKLRMAKLFPKNGTLNDQTQQLEAYPFSIAVGTPHRLVQLAASNSLSLDHTQLVVLDCHLSHKQFNVFTLPDTAPHCMEFLQDMVLPQLQKRNNLRIGFF